ncbi:hypothetical protein THAOC_13405, partial [Thalassiosira oceanica]
PVVVPRRLPTGRGGVLLPYGPSEDGEAVPGNGYEEEDGGEGAPEVIHLTVRGAVDAGSDVGGKDEDEGGGSRSPGGHYWSERVGYTNFDLARGVGLDVDEYDEDFASEEVERRAARRAEARGLRGEEWDGAGVTPLFVYGEHDDPHESAELIPEFNGGDDGAGRRLQYAGHSKSSQADSFASPSDLRPNGTKKDSVNKDSEADAGEDKSEPVIVSAFPPVNTKIGDRQSFGALVRDVGGSGVRSACVQLQDHVRARSPCLKLKHVGEGGGGPGCGGDGDDRGDGGGGEGRGGRDGRARHDGADRTRQALRDRRGRELAARSPVPRRTGVVQTSTGRVLFFYDGAQFVCSATVLKQPARDRTILLTAGHCAYQHSPGGRGRFADYALFVPNQVDTRGTKSDGDCKNDPLGCWTPAFAVVDYEWSTNSFPRSVAWDYAYYVIPNDVESHTPGFIHRGQPELTRLLDHLVEPLPVDFGWEHGADGNVGEFTHGLGYSFDKDPDFRYCAGGMSSKFGIPNYENLWIDVCLMTGGSSGGPWMKDVDTEGRGTVVSVNSWGYASTPGMGGPDFSTERGSKAECLLERAMSIKFGEVEGNGVVVDDC